jgi:GWxTD domain-containing protein
MIFSSSYAQNQSLPLKEVYQSKFDKNNTVWKAPVLIRTYPVYQGNETYRLFFLVEIQHDFLQYIFNGENYTANTEFEINITNNSTNQLQSKILKSEFFLNDFEKTNRKDLFHFTIDSLDIQPGSYDVIFKYRDTNGKGTQHIYKFKIHLPEVDKFYASPILFTYPGKNFSGDPEIFSVQPSALRSYWDFDKELGIQLNTWQAQSETSVKMNFSIKDEDKEISVFTLDTLFTGNSQDKSMFLTLSKNLFLEKEYQIDITYYTPIDTVEQKFPLKIVWFEKPRSLWNLDFAMGPIRYLIEDEKAYDDFTKGNEKERKSKFQEFWKERDPTPDTPFNELQYEFFSRVDSANVKFGRKRSPGWRTDIGKIYILYGEPDKIVDNSLAPISNPFLRWIYNLNDKQLSFTFLAVDGRKRYKLENVEENPL